jgi:dolichyl-phosphate-mannose--protein O-mannosyl transferase
VTGIRARDPRRLFAALGFVCLYVPWGLSPRTLNFSHYLFEALPYACLALGFFLDRALDDRRWRQWAWAYLGVCLALFLFFFPVLTGCPIPLWLFQSDLFGHGPWLWFKSWI